MTAKEKAKELVQKFINECGGEDFEQLSRGLKCARICCYEIINTIDDAVVTSGSKLDYWLQVTQEVENYD